MPYKIIWESEGVVFKWSGKCTYEENINANGKVYGDKRFDSIKYQISDVLGADTSDFTEKDIKVISKLESKASMWNRHMLVAHVTKDKKLIEHIRLYEEMMKDSNWKFGIFDSMEEAREWIGENLNP